MARKLLFLSALILPLLISCVQDNTSTATPVRYTVVVVNQSEQPIDSAKVDMTTQDLAEFISLTDSSGKVLMSPKASAVNQFSVSKSGYISRDTVDNVVQPADSSNVSVILRVMRIHLDPLSSSSSSSSSSSQSSSSVASSSSLSSSSLASSSSI